MPNVISANRLNDGIVVYLGKTGEWQERLAAAQIFSDEAATKAALELAKAAVKENLILDPFAVEVIGDGTDLKAKSLRDSIRAKGPTIDFAPKSDLKTA
jgi:hypothetical protein